MLKQLPLLGLLLTVLTCFGQSDSTVLNQIQLTDADLFPTQEIEQEDQVISLFGKTERIEDLPYTAYVITKEEIKENGYVTLTDALRMVPGIFTSPIGSANEGELFMMHGLRGNRYAEILVNGMTVKPQISYGMPLGSQMPIRQAERIEVIFGSPDVRWSNGTNAGIINIVLKDSERPVFTQADVSAGPNRYSNLDLMFGGKLGRGKRLMKFTAWASATTFNNWDIGFPENPETVSSLDVFRSDIYNSYYRDTRYVDFPFNYRGSEETAVKNDFPHESRQLGLRLAYRKLEIWADYRFRKDHSALGAGPVAVAYNRPSDFTAEAISRLTFRRKPGTKKIKYRFDASILLYDMDTQSSSHPVLTYADYWLYNTLLKETIAQQGSINQTQRDSLFLTAQAAISNGQRFKYTQSTQIRTIHALDFVPNDKLSLSVGLGGWAEFGQPQVNFYSLPLRTTTAFLDRFEGNNFPSGEFLRNTNITRLGPNGGAYAFGSARWRGEKWNVSVDLRINTLTNLALSPRAGISYHFSPKVSVFSNYSTDFSQVSRSMVNNTFNATGFQTLPAPVSNLAALYPRIITRNFELGANIKFGEKNSLRFTLFQNRTNNLLRFDIRENETDAFGKEFITVGYFNNQRDFMRLRGVKGQLSFDRLFGFKSVSLLMGGMFYRSIQSYNQNISNSIGVADFPTFQAQGRISYRPGERWYFGLEGILNSAYSSGTHQVFSLDTDVFTASGVIVPVQIIFDTTGRYHLSRNFSFYYRISNLFNTHYGGISATEDPDALLYNVQPLRRVRVGINYDLN